MKKTKGNAYAITTGIGLQDVDRLKNSSYFNAEADRYLKGEITLDELDGFISSYYKSKPIVEERAEEADKISIRIAKLISDDSFSFSGGQLLSIHRTLFEGLLPHPGQTRAYNISKKEWVLGGQSVSYCDYRDLEMTLSYDLEQERLFSYSGLSMEETVDHLSLFISNLWQIHPFEEGNTRTTAVFLIKYLRKLGFDVTNDVFAKNAWYFRNALVRANYTNIPKGIYADRRYLKCFLKNLLMNENNPLKNRDLRVQEGQEVAFRPTTKESRILELLKANPAMTVLEISKEMNVSPRTISSVLKALSEEGKIARVGGKRYGHWVVAE